MEKVTPGHMMARCAAGILIMHNVHMIRAHSLPWEWVYWLVLGLTISAILIGWFSPNLEEPPPRDKRPDPKEFSNTPFNR